MGRRWKYKTAAEAKAAQKAQQAAFRQARKDGTWVRKHKKHASTSVSTVVPPIAKDRAERHRLLREKYGFAVWKAKPEHPRSEAEATARRQYALDEEAAYRQRHREKITAYNREYRRRKRAETLARAQKLWTAEEWAKWQRRQSAKQYGKGSPAWLVNAVVKRIAADEGVPEDVVTERLIEGGGVEFLMKGAEPLGAARAHVPSMVKAAARAVCLWLDPERGVLCAAGARR